MYSGLFWGESSESMDDFNGQTPSVQDALCKPFDITVEAALTVTELVAQVERLQKERDYLQAELVKVRCESMRSRGINSI